MSSSLVGSAVGDSWRRFDSLEKYHKSRSMSTFAKETFNAAVYAACRPTYPKALFDYIFAYHTSGIPSNMPCNGGTKASTPPRWERVVDLGCGTGQTTTELVKFQHVVAVDPSAKMLSGAKSHVLNTLGKDTQSQFEFVQSSAESLVSIESNSVDMVISAQACHWFNWTKLWPELSRIMRPGATLAFWGYSEFRLTKYPSLTPLISEYSQGEGSLGPYWERPGRTILDEYLVAVPDPANELGFRQMDRIHFAGEHNPALQPSSVLPVILHNDTTWAGVLGYLRTASALHNFHEKHPDDLEREDGDIAARFAQRIMEEAGKLDGTQYAAESSVSIEWPLTLLLVKKD